MSNDSEDLCAICLQPASTNIIKTSCAHTFHARCINDYRTCQNANWKSCSLCRQELSSDDVLSLIAQKNKCEICSKAFNEQNPMYNLDCGHYFHFTCILKKVRGQRLQTCFVCEREYPEGLMKNADYNYKLRMGFL